MANCEYCNKEHDGSYGSGRFCNRVCSNKWCNKQRRPDINVHLSKMLKGRTQAGAHRTFPRLSEEQLTARQEKFKTMIFVRYTRDLQLWKENQIQPSELRCKTLLIFERGRKCEKCGWAEKNLFTNSIPIELEHKDGDCYNNKYSNLELLCPNHHSLTSTFRGANSRKGKGRIEYKLVSQWAKEKGIAISTGKILQ